MPFSNGLRPEQQFRTVPVIQGEFRTSNDQNVMFSTVLGSCVSVAISDLTTQIGGMNHYLLPEKPGDARNEMKYGAMAIELLINALLKKGAVRHRMQAQLFGGGNIVSALGNIGARNAKFASDFMKREEISVIGTSLGGNSARRVQFHPVSGVAKVHVLPSNEAASLRYSERPSTVSSTPDVTLF